MSQPPSPPTNLIVLKPHKVTKTKMETIIVTNDVIGSWQKPPFQREVRVNQKVKDVAILIHDSTVIPGVLVLGVIGKTIYRVDGQHRIKAFELSGLEEALADVRWHYADSMEELSAEFRELNSALVTMKPDDKLRSLEMEPKGKALQIIRQRCGFVGYDNIRRGPHAPILSMAQLIRCWFAAIPEVPIPGGESAMDRALRFEVEEAQRCADFLNLCMAAWGRDTEYRSLWGSCNLCLCAWLYRRMVMGRYSAKTTQVSQQTFQGLLTALSSDKAYSDFLYRRQLNDRDRSPAYNRIKSIFARKLHNDSGKKPMLPSPAWAHGGGRP